MKKLLQASCLLIVILIPIHSNAISECITPKPVRVLFVRFVEPDHDRTKAIVRDLERWLFKLTTDYRKNDNASRFLLKFKFEELNENWPNLLGLEELWPGRWSALAFFNVEVQTRDRDELFKNQVFLGTDCGLDRGCYFQHWIPHSKKSDDPANVLNFYQAIFSYSFGIESRRRGCDIEIFDKISYEYLEKAKFEFDGMSEIKNDILRRLPENYSSTNHYKTRNSIDKYHEKIRQRETEIYDPNILLFKELARNAAE